MKYLSLLILFLSIASCCSKKHSELKNDINNNDNKASFVCPNNGDCKLEILNNKGITKTNETNTAYKLVTDSSKIVIKYNYNVNQDQTIHDGGYAEEILFEINANDYQETLIDENLKKAKLFYRRFCACRGKTGLILVTKGKLEINTTGQKINLNLDFDCGSTPQVIKNIKVIDGKL